MSPTDPSVQDSFGRCVEQIALGPVVQRATSSWIFDDETRRVAGLIERRAKAVFRYLNLRSYLELLCESPSCSPQMLRDIKVVIERIKRDKTGSGSHWGATLEEDLAFLRALPDWLQTVAVVAQDTLTDLEFRVPYKDAAHATRFWGAK